MRRTYWLTAALVCLAAGCTGLARPECREPGNGEHPKTLLRWACAKEQNENSKDNGGDKGNGNGQGNGNDQPSGSGPEEPDEIVTDRPDFTEASSTVGKGRIQLEAGYTYFRDRSGGITNHVHSYPEALFRIGLFADWFELRVGQNFQTIRFGEPSDSGGTDLYLGTKLWLTEQYKFLPETALIIQTTVPTGADAFTSSKMLPGLNLLYGWDVIPDRVSLGGSSQANAAVDDGGRSYTQLAQSLTIGYTLTPKLGAYTEWFAFFPHGATTGVLPEYYFDGGFTYKVTINFQLDIRAGVGLNKNADDFFAGAGFAYRW